MKVYVASSWRNAEQPAVVALLRKLSFDVYDFRNPASGEHGFAWDEIEPDWQNWTPGQLAEALDHPVAEKGFNLDMNALEECDICVLVLPCGRSAHLEAGYAKGDGKFLAIYTGATQVEPELMYKMADVVITSLDTLTDTVMRFRRRHETAPAYPYAR